MTFFDFDIGVIGGGAAGLTVTSGAAQLGAKTLLVESTKNLGGDCLYYGCVPSKTLIKSANVYHMIKNSHLYGLPEIKISPLDYKNISKRISTVINAIKKHDSIEKFLKYGAMIEFGSPKFVDEHTIRVNNKHYSAKKWVIATGSSSSIPQIQGIDTTHYITNREIFYLDHLPESMIILGAGPVAIEMAQAFNRMGTRIHVIQRSNQILSKEDKDMADDVMNVMASEGVNFHLNSSVVKISEYFTKKSVLIKNSEHKETSIKAECIMLASGRSPNVSGLDLENIGVEYDKQGINVDSRLRTSQKNIYAAGDITGHYQYTHAAGYEGGVVLSNAIFHLPQKANYAYMPWCIYTSPELSSIGFNEKRANAAGIEYTTLTEKFVDNDRSLAEGERVGSIKMLLNKKDRPIGVQIVGPHAGELIGEWIAFFNGKNRLSQIASAIHPYPTLSEINKKIAGSFYSPKIFSYRVKNILRLFFKYRGAE